MTRIVPFLTALWMLSGVVANGQSGNTNYILTKLGQDTIAVEEFSMDAHGLQGTSVGRSPRTTVRQYSAGFDAGGKLERFHVTYLRAGATFSDREYVYFDDSVRVTIKQDTSTNRYTVAAQNRPFPFSIDIFGGWQAALQRALGAGKMEFGVLAQKRVIKYAIGETSPGKLELTNPDRDFAPLHAEVGTEGQLIKLDLTETTDKFVAERVSFLDVKAMAEEFAGREKAGKSLGVLSPRDTVRAGINGAHLLIDYGRPAMRGRTIFGHVVTWDSVWRTGANAATQLITDKEIRFGEIVVPPGTYSLFSIPHEGKWMLIINLQHGQWGTNYDQSKDLARIPMNIRHREDLVDRFTFEIESQGSGGILRYKWEQTEASVPFKVP